MSASVGFGPGSVHERRLRNGLRALVLPDSSVPNLAYFTAWRVGSRNERPGITGISHLFEHMMFNGAKKYGPKMFDRKLESNGGYSNAYTTQDLTAYYEVVPADRLDLVLDLELDRMRDLDLSERNLQSEREVVKEERRLRTDESPIGALYEQLYAAAFVAHPYRWPVIGWMADLDAIDLEDVNDYFRVHYSPRNATVAVAGAVDAEATLDAIESVLGALPAGPEQPPVVRSEPEQRGERRIVLRKEAQLPILLAGWHGPDASSSDLYALDVMQAILADGDSSRLRRRLVLEQELAVDAHLEVPWNLDPGLVLAQATPRPGVSPERVEEALHAELAEAGRTPPTDRELRKAKNGLKADLFRRLKTNEGRADMACNCEVLLGDHAMLFELPDRYEAVRAEDVQRVAAATFGVDNRTIAWLDPLPAGDGP